MSAGMDSSNFSAITKKLADLTECIVCKEVYTDPRSLPCVHTYCFKCIEGFTRDKQPGDDVPCPHCRKMFNIPVNGVSGLPKNFFIENLKQINMASTTHSETRQHICEACSSDETANAESKSASLYCVDCREQLCESCAALHKTSFMSRSHKIIKPQDKDVSSTYRNRQSEYVFCENHPSKQLELYCMECNVPTCVRCFVERHHSHKCSNVDKVAHDFRKLLTTDAKDMNNSIETRLNKLLQTVNMSKHDVVEQVEVSIKAVCQRAKSLKEMIDGQKTKLLAKLTTLKKSRLKQLDSITHDIEQQSSFLESLKRYTEELVSKGSATDIARDTNNLHKRAGELMDLNVIQGSLRRLGSVAIVFTSTTLPTEINLLGRVQSKLMLQGACRSSISAVSSGTARDRLHRDDACNLLAELMTTTATNSTFGIDVQNTGNTVTRPMYETDMTMNVGLISRFIPEPT